MVVFAIFFNRLKSPVTWTIYNLVIFLVFELTLFSLIFSCFSLTYFTFSSIFSKKIFSFKITLNSSLLICMSISAWDTKVSMLLSLLLANIRILSCFFFLLLVMLSNFLIIPVVTRKIKIRLALAIPTGAPAKLTDEIIQTPPLAALKKN